VESLPDVDKKKVQTKKIAPKKHLEERMWVATTNVMEDQE
jgi:hypothetical protein